MRGGLIADTVNEDAADSNKVTQGFGGCKDVNSSTLSGVCLY